MDAQQQLKIPDLKEVLLRMSEVLKDIESDRVVKALDLISDIDKAASKYDEQTKQDAFKIIAHCMK